MQDMGKQVAWKATMLASGGLSGGVSSALAGGNFWDGMRQGLITSGLNHFAHSALEKGVDQQSGAKNQNEEEIDWQKVRDVVVDFFDIDGDGRVSGLELIGGPEIAAGKALLYSTKALFKFAPRVATKTSTNVYKHSFKYADRVRMRGVQDPLSHNFPYSLDDAILSTNPILKNNGYKMFQQTGTMNGKNGIFEIGLTKDGIIDHRFFRPIK